MQTAGNTHRQPVLAALAMTLLGSGCATVPDENTIRTESVVDLERFMGDWYVIASIPTFIEKLLLKGAVDLEDFF